MFQEKLIKFCSPTLVGFKCGSLFKVKCDNSYPLDKILAQYNIKYNSKGVFFINLLKKDNSIERVPLKVFQQINPLAVIIVKEKSEVIRERLQKRDGRTYNISQIEMMQKEEIESAKDLCTHLNIQLFESSTENIHETIVFLQNQQFFTGS